MAEAWAEYAKYSFPPEVEDLQRNEMKKAYYAGAGMLFFKVLFSLAPDREPTDADLTLIQDLHDEIVKFNNEQGNLKINFGSKSGKP